MSKIPNVYHLIRSLTFDLDSLETKLKRNRAAINVVDHLGRAELLADFVGKVRKNCENTILDPAIDPYEFIKKEANAFFKIKMVLARSKIKVPVSINQAHAYGSENIYVVKS